MYRGCYLSIPIYTGLIWWSCARSTHIKSPTLVCLLTGDQSSQWATNSVMFTTSQCQYWYLLSRNTWIGIFSLLFYKQGTKIAIKSMLWLQGVHRIVQHALRINIRLNWHPIDYILPHTFLFHSNQCESKRPSTPRDRQSGAWYLLRTTGADKVRIWGC